MARHLNLTKLVAVSLLAISITASTAMAADKSTGAICGSYETRGQYVSVSPFHSQNSDAQSAQDKNMLTSETTILITSLDGDKISD